MPTERLKTTEPLAAKPLSNEYDYLVDRFSAALSLNTKLKDKTSILEDASACEDFLLKILSWDPAWLSQVRSIIYAYFVLQFLSTPKSISSKNHKKYILFQI